jgi:16S rRNA (adenine1518-N6/adenine1519-N6)-dimethyltransferase
MVVTLQREVVQRLRAVPGTKDYGTLTVLVQARYQAGESFRIPPGSFFPAPRVESACVLLERRNEPLLPPGLLVAYAGLVKLAFCQRRKMAFKRLCQQWPAAALERAFAELDLPLTLRAEDIAVEQYAALTRRLPGPCCDPG